LTHIPKAQGALPALSDASAISAGARFFVLAYLCFPDFIPVDLFKGIFHEMTSIHNFENDDHWLKK
jgi:hypothetical protein